MPRNGRPVPSVRLTLQFSRTNKNRLDRLQRSTGARSMVEVICRALAVYEKLGDLEATGGELFLHERTGGQTKLLLVGEVT